MTIIIHFLSSFYMMVIIWFVQIVHYPLFLELTKNSMANYFKIHQSRISYLVVPGMIVEALSCIILYEFIDLTLWIILMSMICCIWLSTFMIQVPCHKKLLLVPNYRTINRLIVSNWIRTLLWTIKTLILGVYLI